jgi:hypothetical protein
MQLILTSDEGEEIAAWYLPEKGMTEGITSLKACVRLRSTHLPLYDDKGQYLEKHGLQEVVK